MITSKAVIDPAVAADADAATAIDAPIARDSGIESNPIPSNIAAPRPSFQQYSLRR